MEKKEEKRPTEAVSPKTKECSVEKGVGDLRESKVNGDDHHEEDMDMSDWAQGWLQMVLSVIPCDL